MKIWYSIQNNGDGSASPMFMTTKELVEWDQDYMDEGWGDMSFGFLIVESESPIVCDEMMTPIGYYLWKCLDGWWPRRNKQAFKDKFFPNGLPEFEARILVGDDSYYYVFVDGVKQYKTFAFSRYDDTDTVTEKGLIVFQKELDAIK